MMTPEIKNEVAQDNNATASFGQQAKEAAAPERAQAGAQKLVPDRLAHNLVTLVDAILASPDSAKIGADTPLKLEAHKSAGQWREGTLALAAPADTEYKGAQLVVGKLSLTMDGNNVARFKGGSKTVSTAEKSHVDLHFVLPPGSDAKQFANGVAQLFHRKDNGVDASKAQSISSSAVIDLVLSSTELVNLGGKSFRIGGDGHRPLPLTRMSIGNAGGEALENVVIDNVELRDVRFHGKMKNVEMSRVNGAGITFARVDVQSGLTFNGQSMPDGTLEVRNGTVLLNQVLLSGNALSKGGKQQNAGTEKGEPARKSTPEKHQAHQRPAAQAHKQAAPKHEPRRHEERQPRAEQRRGGDHRHRQEHHERQTERRFRGDPQKTTREQRPKMEIPYRQERDRSADYVVYDNEIKTYADGFMKDKAPLIGQFKKMTISIAPGNEIATIDLVMQGSNFNPKGLFAKHSRKDARVTVDLELKGFRSTEEIEGMLSRMVGHFESGRDGVIEGKSITTAKIFREAFQREGVRIVGLSGENFYISAHRPAKGRMTDISSPNGLLNLNGAVLGGASTGLKNVVIESANIDRAHVIGKLENVHIVKSSARLASFDNVVAVRGTTINDNDLFGARITGKLDLRDFTGNYTGRAELPADMKVKTRENLAASKDSIWRQLATSLDKEGKEMLFKAVGIAAKLLRSGGGSKPSAPGSETGAS